MKRSALAVILLLTLLSTQLFAAESVDSVIDRISRIKTLQSAFVQKTAISGFGEEVYKGEVFIRYGDRALWLYSQPEVAWYLFTRDRLEYYDAATRQLVRSKVSGDDNVLLKVLFDLSALRQHFNASWNGEVLMLNPKKDIGVKNIAIKLKGGAVKELSSDDSSGNRTVIILDNPQINAGIADSVFSPAVPKGTKVFEQ